MRRAKLTERELERQIAKHVAECDGACAHGEYCSEIEKIDAAFCAAVDAKIDARREGDE